METQDFHGLPQEMKQVSDSGVWIGSKDMPLPLCPSEGSQQITPPTAGQTVDNSQCL